MKLISKFMATLMVIAMAGGVLTSCKSDDDDPMGAELSTPKYEKYAALYEVTDANSDIRSVEFTSAGNYIITTGGNYYRSAEQNARTSKNQVLKGMLISA